MSSSESPRESSSRAAVTATLAPSGLAVDVNTEGGFFLRADEPEEIGGANTGPDPFTYLYTALASCILITIKLYADRKGWPLAGATLRLHPGDREGYVLKDIEYELDLQGDLDEKQLARLRDVAHKCPVHRSLEAGMSISEREGAR